VTAPPPKGPLPSHSPSPGDGDIASWHRLHPLSPVIRAGRQTLTIGTALVALLVLNQHQAGTDLVVDLIIAGLALAGGVVSWLVTRWQVADGALRIETGLVRRQSLRFPLSQVQAIDVVQTGLARVLGLAEIRLRMAARDSSDGRLACLPVAEARQLRERLLAMSRAPGSPVPGSGGAAGAAASAGQGTAAGTPAAGAAARAGTASATAGAAASAGQGTAAGTPAAGAAARAGTASATVGFAAGLARPGYASREPERLLFRVRPARLAAGIALSRPGAVAAVVIAAMAAVAALTGQPGAVAPFLPLGLGIVLAVWRQFNGEFGTIVAAAADGLRLRSGLVQTTAETIRQGRVQAVRLVQPLVWRAFGWCRLEVDLAGPRQRRENEAEGHRLRALIPVGSLAEADRMLGELLTGRPLPRRRAPARAQWKAPLSYHFLGWDGDDRYVVASRGRVSRTTTWVPLEKLQSVRWVQGPVQRRLGLASVRVDVASRRVTGSIEDRDAAEARDILGRLPGLARQARIRAAH
jgi:putative membrane protein